MPDDAPALAELTTADLDPATLGALFADLAALTRLGAIQVRHRDGIRPAPDLDAARRDLAAPGVRGVQVHYHWGGEAWLDTLIPTPGGIRLVRTRAPA